MIHLSSISHAFPHRTLFEDLSFSIHEGEKIALIGMNGAGKSTLLKIMNGEFDADSGRVTRNRGLRVGYLPQSPDLPGNLTVKEYLESKMASEEWTDRSPLEEAMSRLALRPFENTLLQDLSGGWQKKVALAFELGKAPDVLLLDEPTNHLDIESILWLQDFVKSSRLCIVTISHDRAFLNATANRIIEIDRRNPGGILSVDGSYDDFLTAKEAYIESELSREASLSNTLRREVEWLKRGAKARTTKQKARIDRAGELKETVQTLKENHNIQKVKLEFDSEVSAPKKIVELEGVTHGYTDKPLFQNLNLKILRHTRLGLLGNNGVGKSTLIRLIAGEEKPDQGEITRSDRMQVAYFNQDRSELDPELTVLRSLCPYGETVEFLGRKIHVRSYLDRFLFSGARVDMQISKLSGGEQARLLLAKLMLIPANLLILDEPTNDLDFQTLGVLEECLEEFPGAVILVSHDRAFLSNVCDQIIAFPEMEMYSDLSQWERSFRARTQSLQTARGGQSQTGSSQSSGSSHKSKKKLSYKDQVEYDQMESNLSKLETALNRLTEKSSDPKLVSNATELNKVLTELAEKHTQIENLYSRWAELEAKLQ